MDSVNENEAQAAREQSELDHVVRNVADRFPTVDRDRVESVVEEEVAQLEDAAVRDYVPILVEHEAVDRLREEADPVSLAARMESRDADGDADHDHARQARADAEDDARPDSGSAGPLLGGMRGGN